MLVKKFVPCIYLYNGHAVRRLTDLSVVETDPLRLVNVQRLGKGLEHSLYHMVGICPVQHLQMQVHPSTVGHRVEEFPHQLTIERKTKETDIHVALTLDGTGESEVSTGIGFASSTICLAKPSSIWSKKPMPVETSDSPVPSRVRATWMSYPAHKRYGEILFTAERG